MNDIEKALSMLKRRKIYDNVCDRLSRELPSVSISRTTERAMVELIAVEKIIADEIGYIHAELQDEDAQISDIICRTDLLFTMWLHKRDELEETLALDTAPPVAAKANGNV